MSKKTVPIVLGIIIAGFAILGLSKLSPEPALVGDGIGVDFGLNSQLVKSQYSIIEGDSDLYEDPNNRFMFSYPKEFSPASFGGKEIGETVLLQKTGEKAGFQIFITLFDEPGSVLTVERIKTDVPGIIMHDPRPVDLNGEVLGLSFVSESDSFGRSREIWIAKGGFLYQMSTYENEQSLLAEVLSSWRFL